MRRSRSAAKPWPRCSAAVARSSISLPPSESSPHSGSAAYAPTKAGIIGLTLTLAAEFGRDGIRVSAVAPSTIRTPLTQDRIDNDPWFRKMNFETCPPGRPGEAAEVADAVLYLASDRASYVTGTVLPVDGGWSITKIMPRPR